MAGAPLNPTLAPYFIASGRKYGIPPAVLAGVADVETNGGRITATSSAGAEGPMQFEPGTAAQLGIDPYNPAQAIDGTARYLIQLGYKSNPTRALASYNAGPANYAAGLGYAQQVLSNASRLAPALGGYSASSTPIPAGGSSSSTSNGSSSSSGAALPGQAGYQSSGFLVKATLTVALIGAGLFLAMFGLRSTLGASGHHVIRKAAAIA